MMAKATYNLICDDEPITYKNGELYLYTNPSGSTSSIIIADADPVNEFILLQAINLESGRALNVLNSDILSKKYILQKLKKGEQIILENE